MASTFDKVIITNERVTGVPGAEMLRLSGIEQQNEVDVLDLACGGGMITSELLETASRQPNLHINKILAGDIDDQMLDFVTRKREFNVVKTNSQSQWSRVETQKMNEASIPQPDSTFTHVFNNFGIFFCPDQDSALSETYRVLKPSGIAGFTSWKAISWWAEVAEPALAKFLPEATKLPHPSGMFPSSGWNDPDAIPAKLERAGFVDVRVTELVFPPRVEAEPFAAATAFLVKSIAKRVWSEEDFGKFGDQIKPALLKYLKETYEDGIWDGNMKAIITLGSRK